MQHCRQPLAISLLLAAALRVGAEKLAWQTEVWSEPHVRYLLADLSLGGNPSLYREYSAGDPDSREAIRLWDAGARVVNTNDFERRWLTNRFGKDGKVMRVVQRGSERTINGDEALLTSDFLFQCDRVRVILADFALGADLSMYEKRRKDPNVAEALRRWAGGCRVLNPDWFERHGADGQSQIVYAGTTNRADGARIRLNTDLDYSEIKVRYYLADIYLGGVRSFYFGVAESSHETGCREAVARFDFGVRIINLDQFERRSINGQILITRKGESARISGKEIALSTD
jgi:hypothetical protein